MALAWSLAMTDPNLTIAQDPHATGAHSGAEAASALARVLDCYVAELQAGRAPDRARLLAEHPDLAAQLEPCLSGIEFIHRAARAAGETPAQLGDYRIIREVGRGGMGVVHEAVQLSLKRPVALKVLRFGAAPDTEAMQRFQREAETVAGLHHTNIVPIFAVGCEQGVHYYAMQLIAGRSLAAVLDESRGQPLDAHAIARWGLQAAEALAHAHQRGVIHRDIKPSNLLLDQEGVIWLTDFGLAKRADEIALTVTGALVGTPQYMSPEQVAVVRRSIDHRTDLYSLGATLYELATGHPVFQADSPQGVLSQILHDEPLAPRRRLRSLPRDLETIILKCLAKEPAGRYASAQELADDLRAFLDGRTIRARRPSLAERAVRWVRKHRRSLAVASATAVVSVALAVAGALTWVQRHDDWRQAQLGQVSLTGDAAGLTAEVLDTEDRPVGQPLALPTRQPLTLPGGSYRLRVRGPWRSTLTRPLEVEKGTQQTVVISWTGRVGLKTEGPQLLAEVLDSDSLPVVPVFPVPTPEPIVLPAGDYRLRLRGPWQPIETRPLTVTAGGTQEVDVSHVGHVGLTTEGNPLVAEVLDERDGLVVPRFTLPAPDPIALPAASYRIRLSNRNAGLLSATYHLLLDRGMQRTFPVDLDERKLWDPIEGLGIPELVELDGRRDLVVIEETRIRRLNGRTGKEIWSRSMEAKEHPALAGAQRYQTHYFLGKRLWNVGDNEPAPARARLVRPAPDLDGDGTADLVLASRGKTELLALSGKTGDVLWWHAATPVPPAGVDPAKIVDAWISEGAVVGQPLVADVDGDGVPDIIATFDAHRHGFQIKGEPKTRSNQPQRWIEAISGRTGKTLWTSSLGGYPILPEAGLDSMIHVASANLVCHAQVLSPIGDRPALTVVVANQLVRLDLHTGTPTQPPRDLGFRPVGTPRFVALPSPTGPIPAVLLLREDGPRTPGPRPALTLVAQAVADGKQLWSRPLGVCWPEVTHDSWSGQYSNWRVLAATPEWPLVADLDGDGQPEIIVPWDPERLAKPDQRQVHLGVRVLDGATGAVRWEQRLGLAHRAALENLGYQRPWTGLRLRIGADIDGDGHRDVFVAALTAEEKGISLAALSGKDGRPLWRTALPRPDESDSALGLLQGWQTGSDGHPQLVVSLLHFVPNDYSRPATVFIVESGTGRLAHVLPELGEPEIQDLDGDGLPDLLAFRPTVPWIFGSQGRLQAVRGACPESWRHLADFELLGDCDGDGIPDLLHRRSGEPVRHAQESPERLTAISGRDGRVLWHIDRPVSPGPFRRTHPLPVDLDGDGQPDLAILRAGDSPAQGGHPETRVEVLSGKTGQSLWTAPSLAGTQNGKPVAPLHFFFLTAARLMRDEPPMVLCCYVLDGEEGKQFWVAALSGKDGSLRWRTPLAAPEKANSLILEPFSPTLADVDGDGVPDLVFWGLKSLYVLSGRDGRKLWSYRSALQPAQAMFADGRWRYPVPAIGDLDGDGIPEIVIADDTAGAQDHNRVVVLNGKDGTRKWVWEGPALPQYAISQGGRQPPPRIVRRKEGPCVVAAVMSGARGERKRDLVLLNARGQEVQRRPLVETFVGNNGFFPVWVADLDGDGHDEVLFIAGGKLVATRDGVDRVLWEWPLASPTDVVHEIQPATVVVAAGAKVFGLDGRCGKPRWRCESPGTFAAVLPVPGGLPRVLFRHNGTTLCRVAIPGE
jgi:outer membrane protein assembly factor BamB